MRDMVNGEYVVLVDDQDKGMGMMEKMQAHVEGRLHRAISVFIFNSNKHMLLQRRASSKYHSPGLWTNACCSHPREGETALEAATRRLYEEMRLAAKLLPAFHFIYQADMGNGLTEHEYDHVFIGVTDELPDPAEEEVWEWKYMSIDELRRDMEDNPDHYTAWFRICMNDHREQLIN